MTSLAILHAPGDEAAASGLCARLQALRPVAVAIGPGQAGLRLGAHVALLIVWSRLAQAHRTDADFGEICVRHDGLVMVCPLDETPLPEELDDFDYRMIDASVGEATVAQAKRAHDIVAGAERARREALETEIARRERTPSGQALAGGALTGFATTVALFGAMGATAIGAVDQLSGPGEQANEQPPPNMRVLRGIPSAPAHSWAEAPLLPAPTPQQMAAADASLEAVAARLVEARETTEPARARLETVAESELWTPTRRSVERQPPSVQPVSAEKPVESEGLHDFARAEAPEAPPEMLQVARFAPFEVEPFEFTSVDPTALGSEAIALLSLEEPLATQLDWSAGGAKEISYRELPAVRAEPAENDTPETL
jgi:hypothetical protein